MTASFWCNQVMDVGHSEMVRVFVHPQILMTYLDSYVTWYVWFAPTSRIFVVIVICFPHIHLNYLDETRWPIHVTLCSHDLISGKYYTLAICSSSKRFVHVETWMSCLSKKWSLPMTLLMKSKVSTCVQEWGVGSQED